MSQLVRLWGPALAAAIAFSCGPSRSAPKALGEPCAPTVAPGELALDCADGLCVAFDTASGFCTRTCNEDSKCPPDYRCEAAGRYGRVCKKLAGCKQDLECPAGHACDPDTGNCYLKVSRTICSPCQDVRQCPPGGACFLALGSGEQFCTSSCDAEGRCPFGFECKDIPAGQDRALIKQCVPTSMSCNAGKPVCAPCRGDAECGGPFDLCVRNVVSGETFCGRDCDPSRTQNGTNPDCPGFVDRNSPQPFSCLDIGQANDPNVHGPYQCVPNSNTCRDYCDAADELGQLRQCGLGRDCNLQTRTCKASSDGRQCASCQDNDDCRKGPHPEDRCIVNNCPDCPFKGESFCATPCADDAACRKSFGPGFVCKAVKEVGGSTRSFCMPQRGSCESGLGRLGDDCTRAGAQDCVTGVCLVAGNTSMCSMPCSRDPDCGDARFRCCEYSADGYDCSPEKRTLEGPRNGTGVCAPLGGLFGDDCAPGRAPCQSGTCLDLGTVRVCTLPCATGCPNGFSCRKAQASDGNTTEVCFPEGGGKAGADCTFGPAACESGLCIRKDSGNVCTQGCTTDDQCPEAWHCTVVRTIDDQSVQACLPPSLQ